MDKYTPNNWYWVKPHNAQWLPLLYVGDGQFFNAGRYIDASEFSDIHPHPLAKPDEMGCPRCGLRQHWCDHFMCHYKTVRS